MSRMIALINSSHESIGSVISSCDRSVKARAQGVLEGKPAAIGFEQRQAFIADAWTRQALSSAAIEGERLDLQAVRSSVALRLGFAQKKTGASARAATGCRPSPCR